MKSLTLILGAIVIILLLSATLGAITSFRAADYEEPHNIDTGAGVTTANITLSQTLFGSETRNVEISSNLTADAPIPSSYVSATKVLTVSGLEGNSSRRLTLTYKISNLDDYFGVDLAARTWPIFLAIGIIGIIVGAVYNATKHGE